MDSAASSGMAVVWPLLILLVYLPLLGLGIYCVILFIRLAHRGIKALDLYIAEKSNRER